MRSLDTEDTRRSKSERILMLYEYLKRNSSASHVVSRKDITDYLASYNMAISPHTLYTDMELIAVATKAEIVYDPPRHGYYIKNPPFEPYELQLMVDSIQASKFITQEKAREITAKIKSITDKDTARTLDRRAYVANRTRSMNDSVVKDASRIHEAIAADRKIAFRYFHYVPDKENPKWYSKQGNQYIVSPYALLWNNGNYYLYAYDDRKFRYFRVDRMERISRPLPEQRAGNALYQENDLTQQKVKVFDMYSTGKIYDVRMRFRNELAGAVIDQFGKENLIMVPYDAEHFTFTASIDLSPPFFAWIATFGRRVKILSPEPVIEEMKQFLQRALAMYEDE